MPKDELISKEPTYPLGRRASCEVTGRAAGVGSVRTGFPARFFGPIAHRRQRHAELLTYRAQAYVRNTVAARVLGHRVGPNLGIQRFPFEGSTFPHDVFLPRHQSQSKSVCQALPSKVHLSRVRNVGPEQSCHWRTEIKRIG